MKQGSPARIVLIEDNPGDVMVIRIALDEQGFEYQLEVLEDRLRGGSDQERALRIDYGAQRAERAAVGVQPPRHRLVMRVRGGVDLGRERYSQNRHSSHSGLQT